MHSQGWAWGYDEPVLLAFEDAEWTVVMRRSQFRVVVRGKRPSDLEHFKNEVMSIVRGLTDALSFCLAVPLTLALQGGFASPGELIIVDPGWPELVERDAALRLRVTSDELAPIVNVAARGPLVRYALSDIALAIDRPDDSGFYAHRAVESVRQYFVEDRDGANSEQSWHRLRETLNITKDELVPLSKASTPRRHGALPPITADERLVHIKLARRVVDSLVRYISRE